MNYGYKPPIDNLGRLLSDDVSVVANGNNEYCLRIFGKAIGEPGPVDEMRCISRWLSENLNDLLKLAEERKGANENG